MWARLLGRLKVSESVVPTQARELRQERRRN